MNPIVTPINHSDIFFSVESFLEFFSPKEIDGSDKKRCRPYSLPFWHPSSAKGRGLIAETKVLDDGKILLISCFPVNRNVPFEVCLENNWMVCENYTASFEEISAYFVNDTHFGTEGGSFVVKNGPTTFTWTYMEPKAPLCEECESKEAAQ